MELEYAAEWFKYADMDYSTSKHLLTLRPKPLEIICYHCQQAAEKYLKGYLVYEYKAEPPRTHDLVLLKIECMKSDDRYNDISRACEVLTRYGVQPRYPNEMEIAEIDMLKALKYVRKIRSCEPIMELRHRMLQSNAGD